MSQAVAVGVPARRGSERNLDEIASAPGRHWRAARRQSFRLRSWNTAILLLPSLLLIGIFSYYPAVRSLIGGFYSWNGFSQPQYAGLSLFSQYLSSSTFRPEVTNLALLTGGGILINVISQFGAAEVVVHLPPRLGNAAKYLLTLPMVIPQIIYIDVWAYLLTPSNGLVDNILARLGLPQPQWLQDPHLALLSILSIGFPWISNVGFLIFLGGLQGLPKEVLEASRVDGASKVRRIFAVDVPLLMPQFRIVVILSGIFMVQNFIPILLLTNGGPGNATMVPGLDMYQSAFQGDQYGYGMAIGSLLFAAMFVFTIIMLRVLRPRTG